MRFAAGTILLMIVTGCTFAASLSDYVDRTAAAAEIADALVKNDPNSAALEKAVRRIKSLVPAAEQIEFESGKVTTDNAALHALLERLAEQDTDKRNYVAAAIAEQLKAVSDQARQLRSTAHAEAAAQNDKLKEILRRPEYQTQKSAEEESLFARWQREFLEWLSKVFPRPAIAPASPAAGLGSMKLVLQILIFLGVAALIALLLYKFAPGLVGQKRQKTANRSQKRSVLGDEVSPHETPKDLFIDAERLARAGEIRSAIRRAYIATLCDMSDRRLVKLAKHKTNRDYLGEVRRTPFVHTTFYHLTTLFEQSWYGGARSEISDWERFKRLYQDAIDKARSSAA